MYRAGFIGLVGQPNAGKSTLMNALIEEKVSIVSSKPQTTRRRVMGILSQDDGQIVFVDSPGLIQNSKGLNPFLRHELEDVMSESDVLVAVLPLDEKQKEDMVSIVELVVKSGKPWVAVITKTNFMEKEHRVGVITNFLSKYSVPVFMVDSLNLKKETKNDIIKVLLNMCPEAPSPLYDIELFTPHSTRELAAEIVREKCFEFLHDEIPYGLACRVVSYEEGHDLDKIHMEILIGKENHKSIIIGKEGSTLKKIGTEARKDIEKILDKKVFLGLKVTFRETWWKNKRILEELGLDHESRT
ncbi:MAG: GTPase Era [Bdellovibrionota bacterium]